MLDKSVIEYFYKDVTLERYGRDRGLLPLKIRGVYKLLEVGGGSTFSIRPTGLAVCVDISSGLLKRGKTMHQRCTFVRADARYLPFRGGVFNVVSANVLLHHLVGLTHSLSGENIARAVREMVRVRSRGGIISIRELCPYLRPGPLLAYYITKLSVKLNVEIPWLDIHSNVVVYFLTLKQLANFLKMHGLRCIIARRDSWRIKKIPIGESVIIVAKE